MGTPTGACQECLTQGRQGILEVKYDYAARLGQESVAALLSSARTFWDFAPLLPVDDTGSRLDLGQGFTSLITGQSVGESLGLRQLLFKLESQNPTWSFKDRYAAVTTSVAASLSYEAIATVSTGNAGAAMAAFAAKAGMRGLVVCAPETSALLTSQIRAYGGDVLVADPRLGAELLRHLVEAKGWFSMGLFMPGPTANPFGVEGYKTIAYELVRSLGRAPRCVVFPSARGNGLYGAWKGFRELRAFDIIDELPRMVSVQATGAASLPPAVASRSHAPVHVEHLSTRATSIGSPVASPHALQAIYESGGDAVAVTDDEIANACRRLASEGTSVELASAATVAALPQLLARGSIAPDDEIVCVLTAAGIKWPEDLSQLVSGRIRSFEGDLTELDRVLVEWRLPG
jgi:threonine synthase